MQSPRTMAFNKGMLMGAALPGIVELGADVWREDRPVADCW